MATTSTNSAKIIEKLANIQLNNKILESKQTDTICPEYGLNLKDVYKIAINFYRDKEGKAVHFSYEDKLQLIAYTQQISHGPLLEVVNKLPVLGALDVVGRDRRLAWQKLGNLSSDQARAGFVELLSRKCPLFLTFVEAHRREKNEQERLQKEREIQQKVAEEEERKQLEHRKIIDDQLEQEEIIKRQIQQALNEQTYEQFRKYAELQFPGEPEKQGALVKQLQEQHYIQYMEQLQAAQMGVTISENVCLEGAERNDKKDVVEYNNSKVLEYSHEEVSDMLDLANMWTHPDIETFKKSVSQAEGDGVVRVGHGETVTVRVPTHHERSVLFWEFATDHYDIGFGVYFEYGTPTTDQVSVHVSESEDEDGDGDDLDDDYEYDETILTSDLEAGSVRINGIAKPLLTEIVPVYRRDCQHEVYGGSHKYPGQGVYLLKFDNSYSLWRSKTLYYRVYYTQ